MLRSAGKDEERAKERHSHRLPGSLLSCRPPAILGDVPDDPAKVRRWPGDEVVEKFLGVFSVSFCFLVF